MPDLDQLLDTLVDDVRSKTRAHGASRAIEQAHRRRKVVAAAATLAAVAVLAAVSTLAAGTLGGRERTVSPAGSTTPSPTTVQESAEPTPKSDAAELDAILAQAANWAVNPAPLDDHDDAFQGRCSGDWGKDAGGVDGGTAAGLPPTPPYAPPATSPAHPSDGLGNAEAATIGHYGFPSEAQASNATARLVENLESCTATAWRIQPIAQTGAMLASSPDAVAWIQQGYSEVHVLQVPTTDGPPPVDVQVAVVEWLAAYIAQQSERR